MRLSELLFSQGFGTRRVCAGLVEQGLVRLGERRFQGLDSVESIWSNDLVV